MHLDSLPFLFVFFPVTLLLYYSFPAKLKNTVLLLASLVFYSWGNARFVPVLVAAVLLHFFCALAIQKNSGKKNMHRLFLGLALLGNLGILICFKYSNLLVGTANSLFHAGLPPLQEFIIPFGIGIYTLQSISYTLDVYRGDIAAERNILRFATYSTLFSVLMSEPIVRYSEVREQLRNPKTRVTAAMAEKGISSFIFGLAQKILLADTLLPLWTDIVGRYDGTRLLGGGEGIGLINASSPLAWLGVIAYGLQLYYELSGYSLMAHGIGQMLGFSFPENFDLPYTRNTVTGFVQNWMRTVIAWFRDYCYLPWGGKSVRPIRQAIALFLTCLVAGLWIGPNWYYMFWALYLFLFLTIEKAWLGEKLKNRKIWPHLYVLFVVFTGWAIFVGGNPGVGLATLLHKLFVPQGGAGSLYYTRNYLGPLLLGIVCATKMPQLLYKKIQSKTILRGLLLLILLLACVAYMVASNEAPILQFAF